MASTIEHRLDRGPGIDRVEFTIKPDGESGVTSFPVQGLKGRLVGVQYLRDTAQTNVSVIVVDEFMHTLIDTEMVAMSANKFVDNRADELGRTYMNVAGIQITATNIGDGNEARVIFFMATAG